MKSYQLDIEQFQGYMCPGIPVTEDLTIEVEFSDEEVAKIRQLVKDYTGDKGAGLMPILLNDAPELHERIAKAAFQEIYDYYLLDGLRNGTSRMIKITSVSSPMRSNNHVLGC